jgi:hypothetical protein
MKNMVWPGEARPAGRASHGQPASLKNGRSHFTYFKNPARFNALVHDFLTSLNRDRRSRQTSQFVGDRTTDPTA